jgi:hypothetical protein
MTAANGLTTNDTHTFQVDYVTTDQRRPLRSASASGTTWSGSSWGGVPYEWMEYYFGSDTNQWPSAANDSDGDGMNTLQEYLAGTDPTDSNNVLRVQLVNTPQGIFLNWNTQPGLTYTIQKTTDLVHWSNWGAPRFAAGTNDSIFVGGGTSGYYRVYLLRQ